MGLVVALFYWKPVLSFVTLDVGQGFMAWGAGESKEFVYFSGKC